MLILRIIVWFLVSALALAACDGGSNDIAVKNRTDQTLIVTELTECDEVLSSVETPPRSTARFDSLMGGAGPFRIENPDGHSVGRIGGISTSHPVVVITDEVLEPTIINSSPHTLTVSQITSYDCEPVLGILAPGEGLSVISARSCEANLVARLSNGSDYAYWEHTLCSDDEWLIS